MSWRSQPLRCLSQSSCRPMPNVQRQLASLATQSSRAKPSSSILSQRQVLQNSFRRCYADSAPQVTLSPAAKPKRRWGFFRTLWRITYISVLGGIAYTGYLVYDLKYPNDQFDPDPSKKTLVVLGMSTLSSPSSLLTRLPSRLGLGIDISAQEVGHGELQCCRCLSEELFPIHSSSSFLYHRLH